MMGIQDAIAILLTLVAAAYLARLVWRRIAGTSGGSCGSCGNCEEASQADTLPLVQIEGANPVKGSQG